MARKNFRSVVQKKRKKVFYGKGKKDVDNSRDSHIEFGGFMRSSVAEDEINSSLADEEEESETTTRPGPSHQLSEAELTLPKNDGNTIKHSTPDDKRRSRSQTKLDNSSFFDFESNKQLTRSVRLNLSKKPMAINCRIFHCFRNV